MANADVNRLIDMLYERIEDAKSPALKPGMSIVDRDELLDLLDELRAQLPIEIKRAQELLSAREKFVEDAKRDVDRMMRQAELEAKANAMIYSLSNSHVKAKRCNTEELIEKVRRYSSPISANRFKLKEIMDSSFFEDIVSSDSIEEMTGKVKQLNAENIRADMARTLLADIKGDS